MVYELLLNIVHAGVENRGHAGVENWLGGGYGFQVWRWWWADGVSALADKDHAGRRLKWLTIRFDFVLIFLLLDSSLDVKTIVRLRFAR